MKNNQNSFIEKIFFYRKLNFTCEVSLYKFSFYILNNTEPWSNFRFFNFKHFAFESYAYVNSFTLRRNSMSFLFYGNKMNSLIKGTIQMNNSNQKILPFEIKLRPSGEILFLLISIYIFNLFCFLKYLFSQITTYQNLLNYNNNFQDNSTFFYYLLVPLNLILVGNYFWFKFEFEFTLSKFINFFPKEYNLKKIENVD